MHNDIQCCISLSLKILVLLAERDEIAHVDLLERRQGSLFIIIIIIIILIMLSLHYN